MSENQIVNITKTMIESVIDETPKLDVTKGNRSIIINVEVPKEKVGQIIGKNGRIISAIRTIAEALAYKYSKRISIIVVD